MKIFGRIIYFSLLLTFIAKPAVPLFGQAYNPLLVPNTFRSTDNPHYWKNKKPFPAYWQQDVHYRIKANLDEVKGIITGTENLQYWNNSPDTLSFVYFHLYQNAFQPGAYYDQLQDANHRETNYGPYTSTGLGTEVEIVSVNGKEQSTELDNTILKVWLDEALLPGTSVNFDIRFRTYFDNEGNVRRRMKTFDSFGFRHFDGVHWYPRIAVYDRKFGWTTDQHLDKEFYGDFGCYDVELSTSNDNIVGATGYLLNRKQVLPDSLRQALDIKNFTNKPWGESPSVIIPHSDDPSTRKTWIYHAENVHDFAFTADPLYRIGESEWNGIKTYALVEEPHARGWQNAALFAANIIKTYSEKVGPYAYHKMIVADARDGMEYPMMTLDGGFDPIYRSLLAHEIAHNWFFAMVGNNETYRAALDEGFTEFLDSYGLEQVDDDTLSESKIFLNKWDKKFRKAVSVRDEEVYLAYLQSVQNGKDVTLNTHSSMFNGALRHGGGYRSVYFKTASMLYNLQYVLGDELFWNAFSHYFNQWSFCHPYLDDFRNSIIQYTKVDLNWFFDQWLETTKYIDYKVGKVKKGADEGTWDITFIRKGSMQMPVDFTVETDQGTDQYTIPNSWYAKAGEADVLPKWYGWDKLQAVYTAHIKAEGKIKNVIIDPSNRLADINRLDNSKKPPLDFRFDSELINPPDKTKYILEWGPSLWYNAADGLKAGVHFEGNYMQRNHLFDLMLLWNTKLIRGGIDFAELTGMDTLKLSPIDYDLSYETPLYFVSPDFSLAIHASYLDAMQSYKITFNQQISKLGNFGLDFAFSKLTKGAAAFYPYFSDEWEAGNWNNFIQINLDHDYKYKKGRGFLHFEGRSSFVFSDYNYSWLALEGINYTRLGKMKLNTRFYGRMGSGPKQAPESALYLAGGSPEEWLNNKWTRSRGFMPAAWVNYGNTSGHIQSGGGLNARGYAGYKAVETGSDHMVYPVYSGQSGFGLNAELEFNKLINWQPKISNRLRLRTYLFADVASLTYVENSGQIRLSQPRIDAGPGISLTINQILHFEEWKPFTIRLDMPLFLNRTPYSDPKYFQYRWQLGIGHSF